jgi:hypothetical protein
MAVTIKQTPSELLVTPSDSQNITKEKIKRMLPKGTSVVVTDEIVKAIHRMGEETDLPQNLLEEDFMTYLGLITRTRGLGLQHLINAIKYCNLKRTRSNKDAWAITFPAKYDRLIESGKPVDNHVSMYEKSTMVQEIDKEMLIPVHLQYAGAFHKLAQQNIRIAMGDAGVDADGNRRKVSAMVMQQACKTGMEMFKAPETAKLDITVSANDAMLESQNEMNNHLEALVQAHAEAFRKGEDVSKLQIVHREVD